jgi:hypothetical protein
MQQSNSREANSPSVKKCLVFCILLNLNVIYRVNKGLYPETCQANTLHTLSFYLLQIHFNIISFPTSKCPHIY